jgi:tetratricopeptide (TPR) repeat protein
VLLHSDEADRQLAERLEKIRLDQAVIVEGKFDNARAAEDYPRVFAEADLKVLGEKPAAVAARFTASPLKDQLVAALDDWAGLAYSLGNQGVCVHLLEIGRTAAPDPAWGDRLRQINVWKDQDALAELVKEAPAAALSPPLLQLIGSLLAKDHALKQPWHRQAQAHYPADFWLNFNLANTLLDANPVEAAGFFRVALTVRPASSVAYSNLGIALRHQKKLPEAVAAYQTAIGLDPKEAKVYNNLGAVLREQKKLPEAIAACHKAIDLDPKFANSYDNLGLALRDQGKLAEAIAACQKAIDLNPKRATGYNGLGTVLWSQKKLPEAIKAYHKAIDLDPKYVDAYSNLGLALQDQEKYPEAVVAYRKAIDLDPKRGIAHYNLGNTLGLQNKLPEAVAAFQRAIDLDLKLAAAHSNLGLALQGLKKLPEAIAAHHKAIELDPNDALSYNNLGNALAAQKKFLEASAAFQKAIELNPKLTAAYNNLANAFFYQQRLPEAVAAWEKAIALDPNVALLQFNLGNTWAAQKKFPEAIAALQKAVHLDPKLAAAYTNLGKVFHEQKQLPEAIGAYRKSLAVNDQDASVWNDLAFALLAMGNISDAIEAYDKALKIDPSDAVGWCQLANLVRDHRKDLPAAIVAYKHAIARKADFAEAHCNLGHSLRDQGDFAAALRALKEGHRLGSLRKDWPYPSAGWIKKCEGLLDLEKRLPGVQKGDAASVAQLLALADMCQRYKNRYRDAAELYAKVFSAEPKTAEDLEIGHRYNAACVAALAAAGKGTDANKLDLQQQNRLRKQASDWLQADLAARAKLLEKDPVKVFDDMKHWQQDADLTALRDEKELAKLPAQERAALAKFWGEVERLAKQARASYTQTDHKGHLGTKERERFHPIQMTAGKTYVIDMESPEFDTFLRLEDDKGKVVAENDDISPTNQNSRIVFIARADGAFRIVATSFEQRGAGAYTISVREFAAKK